MKTVFFAAILCLNCTKIATLQSESFLLAKEATISPITFSVATIKPAKSDDRGWKLEFTPNGFSSQNVPLRKIIQEAYGIYEEDRLAGGPAEIVGKKFDVEAKIDETSGVDFNAITLSQRRLMLQALLTERFKLSAHHESKELPVYALVIAKKGAKLQSAASNDSVLDGIKGHDGVITHSGRGSLEVKSFSMSDLAQTLHYSAGRIVVDKTGLTGRYDFSLKWTPMDDSAAAIWNSANNEHSDSSASSIFTALQEQLGLKLEPIKAPLDTIFIDHIELPTEN